MKNTAIVFVWAYVFIALKYIPRGGVVGSYFILCLQFENYQTVFQGGCAILHSDQQGITVLFSSHPQRNLQLPFFNLL